MRLISHRGNVIAKNTFLENDPSYIDMALFDGYDCEVDVRFIDGNWYLGHDEPEYPISLDWLSERYLKLWVHCKNLEAIQELKRLETYNGFKQLNYFYHQEDDVTITSHGYIWAHPKIHPLKNSISVMPDDKYDLSECYGVCSDSIIKYKK